MPPKVETTPQKRVTDPQGFFANLPRYHPKVIDFCKGRLLHYPEENTPTTPGVNENFLYHPHAPRFSEYNGDVTAFRKDLKSWAKTNSSSLASYMSAQIGLGNINEWRFTNKVPSGARNTTSTAANSVEREKFPDEREFAKIVDEISVRNDNFYRKVVENMKKRKSESSNNNTPTKESAPSTSSSSDKENKLLSMLQPIEGEKNEIVVNPKDFVTAESLEQIGVTKDYSNLLSLLMRQKMEEKKIESSIDDRLRGNSMTLIDFDNDNPLETISNDTALNKMIKNESQVSKQNILTNIQVEEEMRIKQDLQNAAKTPEADNPTDNPFSFNASRVETKIDDIQILGFQTSSIPIPVAPMPIQPQSQGPISPSNLVEDVKRGVEVVFRSEEECRKREALKITQEELMCDLLILKSGYLNDDLKEKTDDELKIIQLEIYKAMKIHLQKYIRGSTMEGDGLVESLREMSKEISKMSMKLSEMLYSQLIKMPAVRKEIQLNLVITHFNPFLFIKVLSFESAVITSREINTGLVFSNMTHVAATLQRLMVKIGTLTGTMETVLTQNLVLNGVMHASVADLSKFTNNLNARLNQIENAQLRKQVINPEKMIASKLSGSQPSTSKAPPYIPFEECHYLIAGFIIIPVTQSGIVEWTLYDKIRDNTKGIVKDTYECLIGQPLMIFEMFARIKNNSDIKKTFRALIKEFKGKIYEDKQLFEFINHQDTEMLPEATLYKFEEVKDSLPLLK